MTEQKQIECLADACIMQTKRVIRFEEKIAELESVLVENQLLKGRIAGLEKERDALYKSQQAAMSMKARAEILNIIMLGMIDPEIEADEKVCGSDWDYVDDETYKNWAQLLDIRDLEQQAKGLENYVSKTMDNCYILHLDPTNIHQCFLINLNAEALRLRNQAKKH